MGYTINITVGSPPQRIEVYLDISSQGSWIIPTTLPNSDKPCHNAITFNESLSTTLRPTGNQVDFVVGGDFAWIEGHGRLAFDTIGYDQVSTSEQLFIVPDHVSNYEVVWNLCPMAGVVGFAPYDADAKPPSHFVHMVRSGSLEEPLFALRLREPTELSLGRTNPDLYHGPFISVPLAREPSAAFPGGWQITASSLTIGPFPPSSPRQHLHHQNSDSQEEKEPPTLTFPLHNRPATLSTEDQAIRIPQDVLTPLLAAAGFDDTIWIIPTVACSRRASMPNVTFHMANGANLTLTPFDYAIWWDFYNSGKEPGKSEGESESAEGIQDERRLQEERCACMFSTREAQTEEIVLGSTFLKAWYIVFDLRREEVRCECPLFHLCYQS